MESDGWITPGARKRPRLSPPQISIDDDDVTDHGQRSNSSSSKLSASPSEKRPGLQNTPSRSSRTRSDCQYGNKCYRRNANHLLKYVHPLLESLYAAMEATKNFSKIPLEMLGAVKSASADANTLLNQIQILKSSGFNSNTLSTVAAKTSLETTSNPSKNSKIPPATAGPSQRSSLQDALSQVREERRQKYLESQRNHQSEKGPSPSSAPEKNRRKMSMQEKWEASCPFNLFLTKVSSIPTEHDKVLSCNFVDLFDPSLGEVKALLHVNFMIDPEWIFDQITQAGLEGKPTWLIFNGDSKDLVCEYTWLKVFGVKSPFPFGHHHTKMSIVQYTDGSVRFFIYTANLIDSDWDKRTQGIWISPKCPKLVDTKGSASVGDSPTKFKSDIIQYLSTYPVKASAAWIDVIKGVNCSEIKVYLIASAPVTTQSGTNGFQWGTSKMEKVLKSVNIESEPHWPLIIQCSSIGTLGQGAGDWLQGEFAKALSGKDRFVKGPIHVVYPSHSNVKESFEGLYGGGCLPYSAQTHSKQPWLQNHLCQWKADCSGRTRAVPHIKSYCRISPDNSKLGWFLLTSANLSKAAWGKMSKKGDRLSLMSWEAGVLFIPQLLISQNHFQVSSSSGPSSFPVHFDIPVVKYERSDRPWFFETLQALATTNS